MKVTIVEYNKKLVNIGIAFSFFGLFVLLLNCVPLIWKNYGISLIYLALFFFIIGFSLVNFYTRKIKQIGYILFEEKSTKISIERLEFELINSEFNVKFSQTGYEGKSNYIPFLTIGSFTTNPGINTICFNNNQQKFNYVIFIKSETEYQNLLTKISNNYKKQNEKY